MKKLSLIIICISIFSTPIYAQWSHNPVDNTKIYYNLGNVGIGTNNPLKTLDVYNSSTPVLRLLSDNPEGQGYPTLLLSRGGEETLKLEGRPNVEGRISTTVGGVGFMTFYTGNNTEKLRIDNNGSLGIGTPAPQAKLDILTDVSTMGDYTSQQWTTSNSQNNLRLKTSSTNDGINQRFIQKYQGTDFTSLSFFQGKVGIGTTSPLYNLEVYNSTHPILRVLSDNPEGQGYPTLLLSRGGEETLKLEGRPNVEGRISTTVGGVGFMTFYTGQNHESLRILSSGYIGINTTNPQKQLDVNGTIHAREVLVDNDNWSDFVFEKQFILPTLKEVNLFIKTNGHLPNIPSATDVKEKGVNVSEMQARLLQKIEELTLYVIQQDQKIEHLQKQLDNK